MEARNLPDVLGIFFMAWMILGIPSMIATAGGSYLFIRFKIPSWGFLKHPHFHRLLWAIPLCGLLFGVATGYLAAWTYKYDLESRQGGSWYDVVAIPGAPGDAMANSYGSDWQDDEAWDYRSDIAVWNGLFWVSVAMGATILVHLISRKWRQPCVVPSS